MAHQVETAGKIVLSELAETLIGNEIVKMNGEIKELMAKGEKIFNFTIGDFDPAIFNIPKELEEEIIYAYRKHFTNYPLVKVIRIFEKR
jgi:aspartate aminotransferase